MVEIKSQLESFESNHQYLVKLQDVVDSVRNPYVANLDGKKIMICSEGPVFAAAMEEQGKLQSYAILLNEKTDVLERLVTEEASYAILMDGEIPIVTKNVLDTDDLYQLFYEKPGDNRPHGFIHYYQQLKDSGRELELCYDVNDYYNSVENYLRYLSNRFPTTVTMVSHEKILGLLPKKYKDIFVKLEDGQKYSKVLVDFPNFYTLLRLKEFLYREVEEYVRQYGLNDRVPDEMISMFNGTNETVKTLELVTQCYKKRVIGQ